MLLQGSKIHFQWFSPSGTSGAPSNHEIRINFPIAFKSTVKLVSPIGHLYINDNSYSKYVTMIKSDKLTVREAYVYSGLSDTPSISGIVLGW